MFFWNSLAFSIIQWILAIWSVVLLPFLNSTCTYESSQFTYYLSLAWSMLSITLLACEMSTFVSFIGIVMKTDLFQSCGHCWVFQTCWHIECNSFTASSFRIWNNSAGVPPPPPALFVVILPKAHLTSHSRMSGSNVIKSNTNSVKVTKA